MREKVVERRLRVKTEEILGGLALKFISPGNNGMPDRLILLPGGIAVFAECKKPGEELEPLQVYRRKQLQKLGFICEVVDSTEAADRFIREMEQRWNIEHTDIKNTQKR